MLSRHIRGLKLLGTPRVIQKASFPCSTYSTSCRTPFRVPTRVVAKARGPEQAWHHELQRRGAKRKATMARDELPQGEIEAPALPPQDDTEPEYPPLLQHVRNNMLKFSHCVLVTRVGGFYEVCTCPITRTSPKNASSISNMPTNSLLC